MAGSSADATPGAGAADPRFRRGAALFDAEAWFEAHEVWEDQWRVSTGEDRLLLQALIQAAAALHHARRGNAVGARHLRDAAGAKLARLGAERFGVDLRAFADALTARLRALDDAASPPAPPPRLRLADPGPVPSDPGTRR